MTSLVADHEALSLQIEETRNALARNLTAARGALGVSQEQLGAAAGVSRATVNQLEGGASANGDPRLSTVVGLATALGVSPMLLLLSRDELEAIARLADSPERAAVASHLADEELTDMRRLLGSGVAKNRTKAVKMGANAAATAGLGSGALAAAAIGTILAPGLGTAVGAAVAASWAALTRLREKRTSTDQFHSRDTSPAHTQEEFDRETLQ